MRNLRSGLLPSILIMTGCAASPVQVACPPERPIPDALKDGPVSTEQSLTQQYETSLAKLRQLLEKAKR